MSVAGRVFTVPPGLSFLDELARAVLSGALIGGQQAGSSTAGTTSKASDAAIANNIALGDPMALGDVTILLPTRRAARQLQQSFLDASKQSALLLPVIRPIGEASEDLTLLHALSSREEALGDASVPPAVGELERRLVLATLVLQWSEALADAMCDGLGDRADPAIAGARTPAQAMHLARELARLIDMVETENAELSRPRKPGA